MLSNHIHLSSDNVSLNWCDQIDPLPIVNLFTVYGNANAFGKSMLSSANFLKKIFFLNSFRNLI